MINYRTKAKPLAIQLKKYIFMTYFPLFSKYSFIIYTPTR